MGNIVYVIYVNRRKPRIKQYTSPGQICPCSIHRWDYADRVQNKIGNSASNYRIKHLIPGPEVIKLSCSTQFSMAFTMLKCLNANRNYNYYTTIIKELVKSDKMRGLWRTYRFFATSKIN